MNFHAPGALPAHPHDCAQRVADKVLQLVRASLEAQARAASCTAREQELKARLHGAEQESMRLCAAALQRWSELRLQYRNDAEPTWSRLAALRAATERGFYNQEGLLRGLEQALKEETAPAARRL
jgi:hypothetical protein